MRKNRVMIIDDDKVFLEELNETLVLSGYEITQVNDPLAAVDKACSLKPDLIIMDIKMPGTDGFQLAEKFKQLPETSSIPIIGMSAYFDRQKYSSLMSMCGIEAFLTKPFNPVDIIAQIEKLLPQNP